VRILTRYILGEILSNTLIGCAIFTFILFMPYLSACSGDGGAQQLHILECG
jgi:lipopolysaccharide export LptBFGC system permease protein LptF